MSVSGLLQTLHFTRSTFHGATFEQKKKAGLGVVIRNQEGLVMASLSQLIQLPPSTVIEVEALAARRALELALELGFDRIVLEGDSEILIKILKNNSSSLAPLGHTVNDIFFPWHRISLFLMCHMFVCNVMRLLIHSLEEQFSNPPSHVCLDGRYSTKTFTCNPD